MSLNLSAPTIQQDFNRMVSEAAPGAGSDSIRSAVTSRLQFQFLDSSVGRAGGC